MRKQKRVDFLSKMSTPKKQALSALDQLKNVTTVVADTGDFEGLHAQFYQS